jgi:hypothetical protein
VYYVTAFSEGNNVYYLSFFLTMLVYHMTLDGVPRWYAYHFGKQCVRRCTAQSVMRLRAGHPCSVISRTRVFSFHVTSRPGSLSWLVFSVPRRVKVVELEANHSPPCISAYMKNTYSLNSTPRWLSPGTLYTYVRVCTTVCVLRQRGWAVQSSLYRVWQSHKMSKES